MKKPPTDKSLTKKPTPKQKLSDEERHARFVAVAREINAQETPESFDRAFNIVAGTKKKPC